MGEVDCGWSNVVVDDFKRTKKNVEKYFMTLWKITFTHISTFFVWFIIDIASDLDPEIVCFLLNFIYIF